MSNGTRVEIKCPACRAPAVVMEKVLVTWKYIGQESYKQPILAATVMQYTCKACGFMYEDEKEAKEREKIVSNYIKRNNPPNSYIGLAVIIKSRDDVSKQDADNHIKNLPSYCCACLTVKIDTHTSYAICRLSTDHNLENKNDPHEDIQGGVWWISSEVHPEDPVKID